MLDIRSCGGAYKKVIVSCAGHCLRECCRVARDGNVLRRAPSSGPGDGSERNAISKATRSIYGGVLANS